MRKGLPGVTSPPMNQIVFTVSPDAESGALVASWDDPSGGGITTQSSGLSDLQSMIREAVACHFDEDDIPAALHLSFDNGELITIP